MATVVKVQRSDSDKAAFTNCRKILASLGTLAFNLKTARAHATAKESKIHLSTSSDSG